MPKIRTAVLDTAGQEEFYAIREQYMRTGHGFLLVFAVTDRRSFQEIDNFQKLVLRVKELYEFPMLLVGNKCDMEESREVSTEEAEQYGRSVGLPYIECSAKHGLNVAEAFYRLVRAVREFELAEAASVREPPKTTKSFCVLL